MPYILTILGLIAGAGYWYWSLRQAGEAAGHAVDFAQQARGAWRRKKFRDKANMSALTAIKDPVTGAGVMMAAVALARGAIEPAAEQAICAELTRVMGDKAPDETFIYAKWAADQTGDPNLVSLRLAPLWKERLTDDERRDLLAMVTRIAALDGGPDDMQREAISLLKRRLAIAG
jgi:predicted negative regulator of RcsB-dependent stress response